MRSTTILKPGDKRKVIHGAGDTYEYLFTGEDTDGHYFLFEGVVPPQAGPPPHIQHKEEEMFYILEGEITFTIEGEEVIAPKGTYINMPKGVKHAFRNETNSDARILFMFAPAGLENLFDIMVEDQELANNPESFIAEINKMAEPYGIEFFAGWE